MFVTNGSTNDNHMMAYDVCFKMNGKSAAVHHGRKSWVQVVFVTNCLRGSPVSKTEGLVSTISFLEIQILHLPQ